MSAFLLTLVGLFAFLGLASFSVMVVAGFAYLYYYLVVGELPMSSKDLEIKLLQARINILADQLEDAQGDVAHHKNKVDELVGMIVRSAISGE